VARVSFVKAATIGSASAAGGTALRAGERPPAPAPATAIPKPSTSRAPARRRRRLTDLMLGRLATILPVRVTIS